MCDMVLIERLTLKLAIWAGMMQAGVDLGTVGLGSVGAGGAKPSTSSAKSGAGGAKAGAGKSGARPKRRAPVSALLLVGGATRMPAFRRFVRYMTGLEPAGESVDPDQVQSAILFSCQVTH